MKFFVRGTQGLGRITLIGLAMLPIQAYAQQNFEYDINSVGSSVVVDQDNPDYPGDSVRRGQEGWVRMSFVVTPEGRAIDPIVMNSSGGSGFELEARKVLEKWRFEAGDAENTWNFVDIRSEINRGKDRATSNFMRRSTGILTHLYDEENEDARMQADSARNMGGWNLYESTMLWLMLGRVEGAEGDQAGKLEAYSRALAMGNAQAIKADDRLELLEKVFLLQTHFNQYAAADRTFSRIERMENNEEPLERNAERIAGIRSKLNSNETLVARARIFNACDCDEGVPLWDYAPARRAFSFGNADGNVERFEARCEAGRLQGSAEAGKTWKLAPELGTCRIFVFGDDDATFEFIEHGETGDDAAAKAVAGNNVLDTRDRSQ